jgi:hypothetical protein
LCGCLFLDEGVGPGDHDPGRGFDIRGTVEDTRDGLAVRRIAHLLGGITTVDRHGVRKFVGGRVIFKN